jgi:hypothetical protein
MHRASDEDGAVSITREIGGGDDVGSHACPKKLPIPFAVIVADDLTGIASLQYLLDACLYA